MITKHVIAPWWLNSRRNRAKIIGRYCTIICHQTWIWFINENSLYFQFRSFSFLMYNKKKWTLAFKSCFFVCLFVCYQNRYKRTKGNKKKKKNLLIGFSEEAFIQNRLLCLVCLLPGVWWHFPFGLGSFLSA